MNSIPETKAWPTPAPYLKAICVCAVAAISLTACSTASHDKRSSTAKTPPETVMVTYHVTAGKERELEQILSRSWGIYRKEKLVFAQPHVICRIREGDANSHFIEIFTWVSGDAPDKAPQSIRDAWKEMKAVCEPRDGKSGVEGGEVELLTPEMTK